MSQGTLEIVLVTFVTSVCVALLVPICALETKGALVITDGNVEIGGGGGTVIGFVGVVTWPREATINLDKLCILRFSARLSMAIFAVLDGSPTKLWDLI